MQCIILSGTPSITARSMNEEVLWLDDLASTKLANVNRIPRAPY